MNGDVSPHADANLIIGESITNITIVLNKMINKHYLLIAINIVSVSV
jgi:hypothetical protein